MKKILVTLAVVVVAALVSVGTAEAQQVHGYSSHRYGNHSQHQRSYSQPGYRSHSGYGAAQSYPQSYRSGWHDTSHYDYHPGSYTRHRGHYDYVPAHYDYHRSGHRDW